MQRGHAEDDPARAVLRQREGRAAGKRLLHVAVQLRLQPQVCGPTKPARTCRACLGPCFGRVGAAGQGTLGGCREEEEGGVREGKKLEGSFLLFFLHASYFTYSVGTYDVRRITSDFTDLPRV